MSQNLEKWKKHQCGTHLCIKWSARCGDDERKFSLCVFCRRRSLAFHPDILYMWRNIDFISFGSSSFLPLNEPSGRKRQCKGWRSFISNMALFGVTIFFLWDTADWQVYHVTGSQWIIIDSIMVCPWSCINQESLFSVPDGFQEVVFSFSGNVLRWCQETKKENVKFPNLLERSIKVPMHWF